MGTECKPGIRRETTCMDMKLNTGQFAVVFAEARTGIILTPKGDRYLGSGESHQVFDSEPQAVAFAESFVERHPDCECSIRDSNGSHLSFIRKTRK